MLPPFIIEQIRRREESEAARRAEQRPRLELPIEDGRFPRRTERPAKDEGAERGFVILDLG